MQMILKAWIISQSKIRREDNPFYAACGVSQPSTDIYNKEEQAL